MRPFLELVPVEIIKLIIDVVALQDEKSAIMFLQPDYPGIKTCSLVCKTFLSLCRSHLFSSIDVSESGIYAFVRLLTHSPSIGHYIRRLSCNVVNDIPLSAFYCLSRVEHLTLQSGDMSAVHISQLSPLLHVVHLPTVTKLEFIAVAGIRASALIPCLHLDTLDLNKSIFENDLEPHETIKSKRLRLAGYGTIEYLTYILQNNEESVMPIFDLRGLKELSFTTVDHRTPPQGRYLLDKTCNLEVLELCVEDMTDTDSFPLLSVTPLHSFECLKIRIGSFSRDAMPHLAAELRAIDDVAGHFIQYLNIKICLDTSASYSLEELPWKLLDQALAESGRWGALRELRLRVHTLLFLTDSAEKEFTEAWQGKLENYLPALSSQSTNFKVLFYFGALTWTGKDPLHLDDKEIYWNQLRKAPKNSPI